MLRTALLIGLLVGAIFLLAAGNWLVYNDEGLYLDGGLRVLHGQAPYRDFFTFTTPGIFWLLAALFRVFGVSLRVARGLRALDLGVMAAIVYWIACRLGSRRMAAAAVLLFVALSVSLPDGIVVNHRSAANAFALGAIAAAIRLPERLGWRPAAAAGALSILAAWCTPLVGLVSIVIGSWILCQRSLRKTAPAFACGAAIAALIPAGVLAWQGALRPMIHQMAWDSARYTLANRIAYGAMFDSPWRLLAAAHGPEIVMTALCLLATLLPVILPPLVAAVWLPVAIEKRGPEALLLLCGAALVASSLPRWDQMHLLYIVPVFLVLAAVWWERHARGLTAAIVPLVVLLPAIVMGADNLWRHGPRERVNTPAGWVGASPEGARQLRLLLAQIQPGGTLFVFPYRAAFYFLTAAHNPTSYSYLQPGMMSAEDDRRAAEQLNAQPPEWVLYGDFPPEYYLRIWPSSNPADLRMPAVEEFIRTHYAPAGPADQGVEYRLWRRREAFVASADRARR